MAPPSLLTMPVELQPEIFSNFRSLGQLAELCLVCKEVRYLVLPMLYRNVVVDVKTGKGASATNLALAKELKLEGSLSFSDYKTVTRAYLKVLAGITLESLLRFTCSGGPPLNYTVLKELSFCQDSLRSLDIGAVRNIPVGKNQSYRFIEDVSFPSLEELSITWNETLDTNFTKLVKHIQATTSSLRAIRFGISHISGDYHREMTAKEILGCSLKILEVFPGHSVSALTSLTFSSVTLEIFKHSPVTAGSLLLLKSLRLYLCEGTTDFLLKMFGRNLHSQPRLEVFECTTIDDDVYVIERFLLGFKGLRTLKLQFHQSQRLPTTTAITQHAMSLQVLLVVLHQPYHRLHTVYRETDFERLTLSCAGLRQLGISLPDRNVTMSEAEFEASQLNRYIELLRNLRQLRLLKIMNVPDVNMRQWKQHERNIYRVHMPRMARFIHEKLRLRVLGFVVPVHYARVERKRKGVSQ